MNRANITITPTTATLGAFVTGVRLNALSDDEWRHIEDAFHEHAVLIFPQQHLSEAEQVAFGRRFGELSIEILLLSNRQDDGRLRDPDDPLLGILRGNEGWHTDSSFQRLSAKASILSAREVPDEGGQTAWADMRAAYDSLEPERRSRVEALSAYHSLYHSQSRIGASTASTAAGLSSLRYHSVSAPASATTRPQEPLAEPPLRPLVKVHPVTKRPSLFIGRHAYGIPGLDPEESARLLDELVEWSCQPPRVYEHQWTPGDVVIWDNRCVLHRARPWPHDKGRVMVHTRVAGDPATELA